MLCLEMCFSNFLLAVKEFIGHVTQRLQKLIPFLLLCPDKWLRIKLRLYQKFCQGKFSPTLFLSFLHCEHVRDTKKFSYFIRKVIDIISKTSNLNEKLLHNSFFAYAVSIYSVKTTHFKSIYFSDCMY